MSVKTRTEGESRIRWYWAAALLLPIGIVAVWGTFRFLHEVGVRNDLQQIRYRLIETAESDTPERASDN